MPRPPCVYGQPEDAVRVTCPGPSAGACQKVWLGLNFGGFPIGSAGDNACYGEESWFTAQVPSGMLPLELDGGCTEAMS